MPAPHDLNALVRPIQSRIPLSARGFERHRVIGSILTEQSEMLLLQLREVLEHYLGLMSGNNASDIDLGGNGCGGRIWYRVYGNKTPMQDEPAYPTDVTDILMHSILTSDQRDFLLEHRNLDFSYKMPLPNGGVQRFRADMYFDLENLGLNMRKINAEIRPFKSLNLHPEVAKALSLKYLKYGMSLITGITGSGKSSTLDTIIDANNRSVDGHIVIIASPVEMVHEPRRCIVRHREVGRDTKSFKQGAIEALRQDPDIIMIGELRDPETIMTALEITDSGHKTFSTMHTASATESIDRIIGEVSPEEQERVRNRLADVLTCVISQKLIPTLDGKRTLAKEILLNTPSIKAAIRNNNTTEIYQMLMEGGATGMQTMEQDLKRLVDERVISVEEAYNYANNKKKMKDLIG